MQTTNALESIDPRLRTFFVPQMEQLRLELRPHADGVAGVDRNHMGVGRFFARQLGSTCLVTSHRFQAKQSFVLEEETVRSLCVASVTAEGIALCPIDGLISPDDQGGGPSAEMLRPQENVAVFNQVNQRYAMPINEGDVFDSTSVCLLPSYFESLRESFGPHIARAAFELMERDGFVLTDENAPYVRAVLRSLGQDSGSLSLQRQNSKNLQKVLALLTAQEMEHARAFAQRGNRSHLHMVNKAKALIQADPAHAPTVEQLAGMLHLSRARLCAVFKEEAGLSIGAFAAQQRIGLACSLLENPRLSIAQVAQAAGYAHQSSFSQAFKQVTGLSPSQWRVRRA